MQLESRYHHVNDHSHLVKLNSQDFSNTQWMMSSINCLKNSVNPTSQGENDHPHNGIPTPTT